MKGNGKRILIIEDNLMLAETYVDLLRHSGYEVPEIAVTGEDALRVARVDKPDLVLMDVSLKGPMDGIETALRITGERDIPVIFISGFSDERSRARMGEVKNHRFLVKPVDFRKLEKVIAEVLG